MKTFAEKNTSTTEGAVTSRRRYPQILQNPRNEQKSISAAAIAAAKHLLGVIKWNLHGEMANCQKKIPMQQHKICSNCCKIAVLSICGKMAAVPRGEIND